MKAKRVLITYSNNGNMSSQIARELMFKKVLREFEKEGRKVLNVNLRTKDKEIVFTDGSKIYVKPVSTSLNGLRVTHLYIDDNIKQLPNGEKFIKEVLSTIVLRGERDNFETSGEQLFFFDYINGSINVYRES